jgi:2',3'-cyclic-nucleotide 2'-phosphodiesterase (5'-nucleotidase family)
MRLTILHFNDLHGRLEQMPRLFTLIQRERADAVRAGRQVLLLDGGDSSDGTCWESVVTQGRANYNMLEAMGVEATVVGNADALNWGRAALARMVAAVHFPVLAANLVDSADPSRRAVPGLKGSVLLDLGGFSLGLIGLTQTFPEAFKRDGYGEADPRSVLRREIDDLRAQGPKLTVLLSHLGLLASLDTERTDKPARALHDDSVAAEFPEIGVIVGGHTHSELQSPLRKGNTIIVQAGDHGRYLGRLDLTVDDETGVITAFAGRLIPCGAGVPLDPTIQGTLELVIEEAARIKDGARPTMKE